MMYNKKYNKKFDNAILGNNKFLGVVKSIIFKMFAINTDYNTIYIDLNSCLSVIFRYPNINENTMVDEVYKIIEAFLLKYSNKKVKIIILWTTRPSKYHVEINKDWCKERYARVDIRKSTFIKTLILGLKRFSESSPDLFKLINIKEIHPAIIVKHMEMVNKDIAGMNKRFVILSKDNVFRCLNMRRAIVYTGVDYIDFQDNFKPLPDHIELDNSDVLLKYYLALRGDRRNEYSGAPGYGVQRSLKYIKSHKVELLSNVPIVKKEGEDNLDIYIGLYSKLWDVQSMYDKAVEEYNLNDIIFNKE